VAAAPFGSNSSRSPGAAAGPVAVIPYAAKHGVAAYAAKNSSTFWPDEKNTQHEASVNENEVRKTNVRQSYSVGSDRALQNERDTSVHFG
jgi:hypothetical protein